MSNSAKVYPVDTINGTVELTVPGGYFKLMTAPAAVSIELLNNGRTVLNAASVPAGFYQRIPFNTVRITHTGVQAITVLVAPSEGGSDNFTGTFTAQGTLGTLAQQSVNGVNALVAKVAFAFNDAVTGAGQAFYGGTAPAALAANNSHSQLKNPAGSNKVVWLDSVDVSAGDSDEFTFRRYDTDLTTLVGTVVNKDAGGAAGSSELRTQRTAPVVGVEIFAFRVQAVAAPVKLIFDPPVKLGAGEGVMVVNATVNLYHRAFWQVREEAA